MKKIKVGILGCNYMGSIHADCYSRLDNVEVAAVADLSEQAAMRISDKTGARVFSDASELIRSCELDALDICLPTFLHTRYALEAMDKVPYLFIEKPVALNENECDLLQKKQQETKTQVQIGHVIRFWKEYDYLKTLVEENKFGKVLTATFSRVSPSPAWSSNNWRKDTKLSGGAVLDLHIHDIDFMLYLFGEPENCCFIKNINGEKNSFAVALCTYDDFVVSVEGTWLLPSTFPFNMYYRVVFEQAAVEFNQGVVTVYEPNKCYHPDISKNALQTEDFKEGNISELDGYLNELKYFTDCAISGKKIEKATLYDGVRSLKFVLKEI